MSHSRLRALFVAVVLLAATGAPNSYAAPAAVRFSQPGVADSLFAGTWKAQARSASWNGRFILILEIEQEGDSVHAVYRFDFDGATVTTPTDAFGRVTGNRMRLADRQDTFWLDATLKGSRLSGRLAHGSRELDRAISINFSRER